MFWGSVTDIVGLYLDPPDRAVVLCVHDPSQRRALDRTQPGLLLKKGRAATSHVKRSFGMMTHDYKCHVTTTLFAALDVKSGTVAGECLPRHRAREFLRFLRRIDRAVLNPRDVRPVLDTCSTHKTPEVKAWLENTRAARCAAPANWVALPPHPAYNTVGQRRRSPCALQKTALDRRSARRNEQQIINPRQQSIDFRLLPLFGRNPLCRSRENSQKSRCPSVAWKGRHRRSHFWI